MCWGKNVASLPVGQKTQDLGLLEKDTRFMHVGKRDRIYDCWEKTHDLCLLGKDTGFMPVEKTQDLCMLEKDTGFLPVGNDAASKTFGIVRAFILLP